MKSSVTGEVQGSELSRWHKLLLVCLVGFSSSVIYYPIYFKGIVYEPLKNALEISDVQMGVLPMAFAWTALLCYFPSGIVADRVRVRTLFVVGGASTAALTFFYTFLPSFGWLIAIHIGYGFTTILIWWGVRYKLIRLFSTDEEYPGAVGLSYGLYGLAGLAVGGVCGVSLGLLAGQGTLAIRTVFWVLTGLLILVSVLAAISIPKFKGELDEKGGAFNLSLIIEALRNPVILMCALCMFFVYFFYTSVQYTTPYMEAILGSDSPWVSTVGSVRQYGITLLAGPIFGALALKVKSPSKVIVGGCLAFAVLLGSLLFVPAAPAYAVVIISAIILLGFCANGVFGIVSAELSEGKVSLKIFGTATGIVSVVGFLPDTFSHIFFGYMLGAARGDQEVYDALTPAEQSEKLLTAFPLIFSVIAGIAILAAVVTLILLAYLRERRLLIGDETVEEDINV